MRNLSNIYRPSNFDEVIGQEHMTSLLKPMVNNNSKLPSGFVFVGKAGSGKSTTARILAKAANCTGENKPCGSCKNCELFNKLKSDGTPAYPDYIEVDAASYGKKDDLQHLLDIAGRSPDILGGVRIIFLDEAHRVSKEAFDTLLKPLEEGMSNAIWIFGTTEVDKMPSAILSRCPTYTTKPLSQKKLYGYLKYILESEKVPYEEESLTLLSYNFAGKTRDAVIRLDSYILAHNKFTGYADKSIYETIIECMMFAYNKDIEKAYEIARETISFSSEDIGVDVCETILAVYTKNTNLVDKDVLEGFTEVLGNNLNKLMSIYLNNNINNIEKFILSLCLIGDLNKSKTKTVITKRRLKTENEKGSGLEEEFAETGKFN